MVWRERSNAVYRPSSLRDERGNVVLRMGDLMSVRVEIHAGLA